MLRAWCLLIFASLTTPLTASSLLNLNHTSNNGLISIKSSNDTLVDVQIQVQVNVNSKAAVDVSSSSPKVHTSESQTVSPPALTSTTTFSDHSSTTTPINISNNLQNNNDVLISRSSPSPSSSPTKPTSHSFVGSVILGSDSTLAFVTDFSGAYSVPTPIMTLSVISQDTENTNGSNTDSVPDATAPPAVITSGVQAQGPHTSIIAVTAPTKNSNSTPRLMVNLRIDVIFIFILSLCSISIL